MNELIKTICLILITFSIVIGVGFYCWGVFSGQVYYQKQGIETRRKWNLYDK